MITAAEGAEKFYDFSNEARYENIEEARARDKRLREAYLGHHRYFVIGNQGNHFGAKINKTIGIIQSVLGLPTSQGTFKKYQVDGKNIFDDHSNIPFPDKQQVEKSHIIESFFPLQCVDDHTGDKMTLCVRQRSKNGAKIYNYEKRYIIGGERI